jgi:glutamate--cysteine ligase
MRKRGYGNGDKPLDEDRYLSGMDDLLSPFHEACKPRSEFRIGIEAEKFGVHATTGAPLSYAGAGGVRDIFDELVERYRWVEGREHESGPVVYLKRGNASITLEPGAQLELSGAPHRSIHDVCSEFRDHMTELREVSGRMAVSWLGTGFHPFARQSEMPWVPKLRYGVMRHYLPTRGARALDMMQRTCTVQTNLDFESEQDAVRKLRVALAVQPVATAIFANSPLIEGRVGDSLCERGSVWLGVDPDRTGILPFAWDRDFSFRDYVEWALDVPMFLIKRGARVVRNTGQSFRSFLANGYRGHRPTRADWDAHLSGLFPEARLRKTLEVRGADAQDDELVCAVPAFWKGLFYDERALDGAEALVERLTAAEVEAARPDIARNALRANLCGRPVLDWAEELADIACGGLQRLAELDENGENETVHLARVRGLVCKGRTPAEATLSRIDPSRDLKEQLLETAAVPERRAAFEAWSLGERVPDSPCHSPSPETELRTAPVP